MVKTVDNWAKFHFCGPTARQVELVGDFTGTDGVRLPMHRGQQGCWTVSLRLPPGVYKFKYCADGQWVCDYAAFGVERSPSGFQSVICVEPQSGRS